MTKKGDIAILKLRCCKRCNGLYKTKGIKRSWYCPNCTRGNRPGYKTGCKHEVGKMHDHKKGEIIPWEKQ
jgi:hypothetical protein